MDILIRYIGAKAVKEDATYATGPWRNQEERPIESSVAVRLLQHPDIWELADDQAELPLLPVAQPVPAKEDEQDLEQNEHKAPLVQLDIMTKADVAHYAKRNFGIELPATLTKPAMIDKVRALMGNAPTMTVQ